MSLFGADFSFPGILGNIGDGADSLWKGIFGNDSTATPNAGANSTASLAPFSPSLRANPPTMATPSTVPMSPMPDYAQSGSSFNPPRFVGSPSQTMLRANTPAQPYGGMFGRPSWQQALGAGLSGFGNALGGNGGGMNPMILQYLMSRMRNGGMQPQ